MNYSIILRPLIGALIGYITNWIAVKMMFKPLNPVKIGKFTLPFTPGIIPKNKKRLAKSISEAISTNLLTEEDIKNNLLSDNIRKNLDEKILSYINKIKSNNSNIKEISNRYITEEKFDIINNKLIDYLSSSIFETVKDANLGYLIANQIELVAKEKTKGSLLGLIGANSIIESISRDIEVHLNLYIKNNGKSILNDMISKEFKKYTENSIFDISSQLSIDENLILSSIEKIYEKFIMTKFTEILNIINITKIVEDKINDMDIKELEKLILEIMKKELNALINLGAIIGFVLGMINLVL